MIRSLEYSSIKPTIPIILASGSESRKLMLEEAGIEFNVIVSGTDEDLLKDQISNLPFEQQVVHLAKAKAQSVSMENTDKVVIGGDQMCVLENTVFNKPGSKEKAIENLKLLSGKTHSQNSGVCIYHNNECLWEYSETVELRMHSLSEQEIKNYVEIENPIHAAGAYKFESLGCNLFSSVNGSSFTVRGMPLLPLLNALRELQIISLKNNLMNALKIFNTLNSKKEIFIPIDKNHIKIYACGPTVYNFAHIGNARMAVVFDTFVRTLRVIYPKVTYVSNITDIDDKIIEAAKEQNAEITEITEKYTEIYNEDMSMLNVLKPDIQPKATEYIPEMIELIKDLIIKEFAYEKDGHVLFHVPSYSMYGELSNRNREEQIAGSRVEVAF